MKIPKGGEKGRKGKGVKVREKVWGFGLDFGVGVWDFGNGNLGGLFFVRENGEIVVFLDLNGFCGVLSFNCLDYYFLFYVISLYKTNLFFVLLCLSFICQ